MARIYQITNTINGKRYVGKTNGTISNRFKQHKIDSRKVRTEKRPLYSAIKKYGIENFEIQELEECPTEISSEREVYWIEKLGTFKYGYNATCGGDGTSYIDRELVILLYKETQNQAETSRILGICVDTVRDILRDNSIDTSNKLTTLTMKQTPVKMIGLQTNSIIKVFSSLRDAERFIKKPHATAHISQVCRKQRKQAYGYYWEYL